MKKTHKLVWNVGNLESVDYINNPDDISIWVQPYTESMFRDHFNKKLTNNPDDIFYTDGGEECNSRSYLIVDSDQKTYNVFDSLDSEAWGEVLCALSNGDDVYQLNYEDNCF